jgi:ribosomal protein L12E/L44/L45/RPP1/RPP2
MAINYGDLVNPGTGNQSSPFAQDIYQAVSYKPVTEDQISQAISQYGVKYDPAKIKGQSDTSLYNRSVNEVLAWYKKNKADAEAQNQATQSNTTSSSTNASQYQAASGTVSGGGLGSTQSSGSSSSGASMPDTAAKPSSKPYTSPLPDIYLSAAAIRTILASIPGASTSWTPPKSVTTSDAALRTWANAQVKLLDAYRSTKEAQISNRFGF